VVLARFDHGTDTSSFTRFVVALDDDLRPFVKHEIRDAASPADRMTCWIFGQGAYVDDEVFNGPGAVFLDVRSRSFLTPARRVAEVSAGETLAFLRDTFQAVEIVATSRPPQWGVGGPVDIVRLHKPGLEVIQMKPGPGISQAQARHP
jgi:hypothetical protein